MSSAQITVVRADDASSRHAHAVDWLGRHGDEGAVILAPTRGAADALLRRRALEAGGVLGIERLTLMQLAGALTAHDLAVDEAVPVAGLGTEALAARAVGHCLDDEALRYFEPVARLPGFARALARTLSQLRGHGIASDHLLAGSPAQQDLGHLLDAYETALDRWSLSDVADLMDRARRALERGPAPDPRLGKPLLVLDPPPVERVQRRFLERLIAQAPTTLITLPRADRSAWRAFASLDAVEAPADDVPPRDRLGRLRRSIFAPTITPPSSATESDAESPSADTSLDFFGAPGESRECVEMARRIRDLARADVPFDRVAILLRDPGAYLPLVEDALHRAEIPAYFTRGTVRPHPAGRAFLALLACADEQLSAARFAEYLSLGQAPAVDERGAPPPVAEVPWVPADGEQLVFSSLLTASAPDDEGADPTDDDSEVANETDDDPVLAGTLRTPRRWERLLVDAAVVGGRDRWARRLAGLEAETALRRNDTSEEDETRRQQLEDQLASLKRLRRFALPVIDQLAALPRHAIWGAWLDVLERLAARVLRRPEQVLAALGELRPMAAVGPVGLDEVRRTLEERLTSLRTEPATQPHGRLFVGTLDDARGRSFDAVFVPGLAEGLFPRRASEDPLLLDDARRALDDALETQADRVERERMLLRLAIGTARQRLVISYPNLDTLQGRARVPSFYALDVLRAADGALPDLGRLERLAAARTGSILGWPAPRQPEHAIDDAEYDLAVLEPLLRQPARETRGRGRYLLETNDHLARALRTRARRWRGTLTGADGIVEPDGDTLDTLAAHRLRARSYSPTALQRYAECPYRFLLYAIHRLRPRDEAVALEQLDPLTRGALFHQVQRTLLETLKREGLLPVDTDRLPQALAHADATLDQAAADAEEKLAPAIDHVWASEIESLRTDLHGWLHAVVGAGESWTPAHFELSFGLPLGDDHDPASRADDAVVLDGYHLRGSIDLVEIDPARGVVRVTDHKTGLPSARTNVVVGRGEVLQPLLYALAAEHHLERRVEAGRLFYCTRRGRFETREVPLDDTTRGEIRAVLDTVDDAVARGFLPAAPRPNACRYCDYTSVCGPNEAQRFEVKMKHPTSRQRLGRLETLRRRA